MSLSEPVRSEPAGAPPTGPAAGGPPRRRWSRRRSVLVGGLVLTPVVLIGVDRAALAVVERTVAGRLQDCLGTTEKPSVRISGFPILTDLVRGRISAMELTARGANAQGVKVDELHVDLHGVERQGEGGSVEKLTGTGLVGYDSMSATAPGVTIAYGGDGKFTITAGISVFSASAMATPSITDDVLTLKPEQVSTPLFGSIDVGELPTVSFRLRELPQGLDVKLDPTERGLEFAFSGTDVAMPGDGCSTS